MSRVSVDGFHPVLCGEVETVLAQHLMSGPVALILHQQWRAPRLVFVVTAALVTLWVARAATARCRLAPIAKGTGIPRSGRTERHRWWSRPCWSD
jgi:hypothetical protein